ncbi:MAG: hypothetical protein M0R80_04120 [Proteobacteria bacterium]|jgi:hypothetical protein|nr:hypothetical protein [Pseudomonadota bacterium]
MKTTYFVSRQLPYYQPDIGLVEIAYPNIDYSGSDMLVPKYAGEGESYNDPIEALESAISIMEMWRTEEPNKEIGICYGHFDMGEGEPEDIEELRQQISKEYEQLPKCDYCNELIDENEYYTNDDSQFNEEKFCSEFCADESYIKNLDLCYICEHEFKRQDMNYWHDGIYICPKCEELEENFSTIDIEKINDNLYVGYSLEDQQITRYLLNKTYLTEKDFSLLEDMLEKLVIDIYVVDENGNTKEFIEMG